MPVYIAIKSAINAFRYGIDPDPEWFSSLIGKNINETIKMGAKIKCCIRENEINMIALRGDYIGMMPDGSIYVFTPSDFHKIYTLKI